MGKRACCLGICISTQVIDVTEEPRMPLKIGKPKCDTPPAQGGGGGGTWVFFGWVCAAQDSKLAPRSKNNFPLELMPRSRNGLAPKYANPAR